MKEFLVGLVMVSAVGGLLITALMRVLPARYIANEVGQSLRARNIYPDIDKRYLNKVGLLLNTLRWICFALFAGGLIAGVCLGL